MLGRPEKKENKIKGNRGEPAKNLPMLKLVFFLEFKNSNFRSSGKLPSFDVNKPYIVSFGVVTCLVTSFICLEVRRLRLNFHDCYRS